MARDRSLLTKSTHSSQFFKSKWLNGLVHRITIGHYDTVVTIWKSYYENYLNGITFNKKRKLFDWLTYYFKETNLQESLFKIPDCRFLLQDRDRQGRGKLSKLLIDIQKLKPETDLKLINLKKKLCKCSQNKST